MFLSSTLLSSTQQISVFWDSPIHWRGMYDVRGQPSFENHKPDTCGNQRPHSGQNICARNHESHWQVTVWSSTSDRSQRQSSWSNAEFDLIYLFFEKRELSKVNQFNKKSLWLKKADECLLGSKRLYYNWQKGCFRKCQHWDKDCFWHEEYLKVHLCFLSTSSGLLLKIWLCSQ